MEEGRVSDADFAAGHEIKQGHEYAWVVAEARRQYEVFDKAMDTIDGKLASMGTLCSGLVVALGGGIVAGLSSNAVDHGVVKSAIPSFVMAIVSLWLMVWARHSQIYQSPPSVRQQTRYAEHYKTADQAQGAMIGPWHLAVESVRQAVFEKARRLDWCVLAVVASLSLLAIPVWKIM